MMILNTNVEKVLEVKVKKLSSSAVVPKYAKLGDAGMDLVATSVTVGNMFVEYGTSLSFEIPEGFVGLIFPRSSLSNYHLTLANSVGVVDSGYRGEVKFRFKATEGSFSKIYNIGEKVGQLIIMPFPKIELVEVEQLTDTERGTGGYGSSGV